MILPFLCDVVVGSFLGFLTSACLIELALVPLWGRHPRLAAMARCISFVKLPCDLFRYNFANWTLLLGTNPLLEPIGTRSISAWLSQKGHVGISFCIADQSTFAIGDLVALTIPHWVLWGSLGMILCGSMLAVTHGIQTDRREARRIHHLLASAVPRELGDTIVLTTSKSVTPFATGLRNPVIVLPETLRLTPGERAAVIAHERAHLRWWDGSVRQVLRLIAALFWWVPTQWLIRRIENSQELACDQAADSPLELAQAMHRAAALPGLATALGPSAVQRRIKHLLRPHRTAWLRAALVTPLILMIGAGRYWIF